MLKNRTTQTWARRLHIYISMSLLLIVLFFTLTGITLNHSDYFVGPAEVTEQSVCVPKASLFRPNSTTINKEGLIEYLKMSTGVKGFASEMDVYTEFDQGKLVFGEVSMDFKSPGYDATIFLDLKTHIATVQQRDYGVIALLNDAHKGRNSGANWQFFIDVTAILMTLFIFTGVILAMPKRRTFNLSLKLMVSGSIVATALYWLTIP